MSKFEDEHFGATEDEVMDSMSDEISIMQSALADAELIRRSLVAELAAAKLDAERYRWMRDHDMVFEYDHFHSTNEKYSAGVDPLGSTIDAVMNAAQPDPKPGNDQVRFVDCIFKGDPPYGDGWNDWAAVIPHRGVFIRAIETGSDGDKRSIT